MIDGEVFRRRNLPHWDVPGACYFVTSCLEGSIPAQGLLELRQLQQGVKRAKRPADISLANWQLLQWKKAFVRIEHWLDREPAVRSLADENLAKIVMNSLLHFVPGRLDVFAFVIMPSHFHWVFRPNENWARGLVGTRTPRQVIMHSIKGFSASRCNRHRGESGTFWQAESYDHWIRDADEFERILLYIEGNPVKAGLVSRPEDWPFSSAKVRLEQNLTFGEPLLVIRTETGAG